MLWYIITTKFNDWLERKIKKRTSVPERNEAERKWILEGKVEEGGGGICTAVVCERKYMCVVSSYST